MESGRKASIGYNIQARQGTKLTSMKLSLDGKVVRSQSISGTGHSDSYAATVSQGSHSFTVTATSSDGGVSSRSYAVTCP